MRFAFSAVSLAVLSLPALRPAAGPGPDLPAPTALRFATAVAIAGDQILVGRPGGSGRPDAPLSGVHVFHWGGAGQWVEAAVLAPHDLTATDAFGAALAVDGALLAVGAPGANQGRGAIYLFQRDRTGRWQQRAKLRAAAAAADDSLGSAVALRGGLLLAGAPGHATERGMAVVFRRGANAATWIEQATLQLPASAPTDTVPHHFRFGHVLAIADGRLVVGAPGLGYYSTGELPGQVVVFRDSARTWVEERRMTATSTSATDAAPDAYAFGSALAADGATIWTSGGQFVREFHRDSTGHWAEVASIRPADASPNHGRFGQALVYDGRDLLVSDPNDSNSVGAIYVFRFDSVRAAWTEVQRLIGPDTRGTGSFGQQLAVGQGLLVVGEPRKDGKDFAAIYHRAAAQRSWQPAGTVIDTAWNPWTGKPLTGAVVPCRHGKAYGVFDCQNVDLLAYLPLQAIGMGNPPAGFGFSIPIVSDIWGWTDPATQREFAFIGRVNGTAFVEVTDPVRPRYLGTLPLPATAHLAVQHTIKVYQHHAFIVADPAGAHGVQVFDLTQLLSVKAQDIPVTFQETARYDRVESVHNIIIDTTAGFAYATQGGGGLHIIDIRDPKHPTYAGQAPMDAHDAQCVTYHGPDQHYQGRQICINANVSEVGILDVTNKQEPKIISTASYPNIGIAHQGWFTDDQRYFVMGDEGSGPGRGAYIVVLDLRDLGDPIVAKQFLSPEPSTAHNLYIRGPYVYQGNYKAGLRVLDIHDPVNPKEVGYFDTTPNDENDKEMWGAWGTFPFFKSGAIAVSSMNEGLFLMRFKLPAPPQRRPTSP